LRKINLVRILLILTLTTSIIIINQNNFAVAMDPSKLKIYVGPTSVPADNNIYECVFVQLQDSNSKPARAIQDTTISLSSSLTSVGDVDPTITISKGSTFAVAKFHTTFTPGTTTIAATASGYATVQTPLITVAPVPSKLAVYGFPPVLPSDGVSYNAIVVQIQDSTGNPAKAPLQGITVALSSSNSTIASVAASATITSGQTYALASVISTAPGSATITAMTSGYTSAQATIRAEVPSATQPTSIQMYVAPPKTLADNTEHEQIVVQLLNAAGKITQQPPTPIPIQMSSSDESVGKVQPILTVIQGRVYATATFFATYKAGTTTITAAATDLKTDTEAITTIGPIPSRLVAYCNPSGLPADNKAYNAIQVQLQDAQGKPALDPDGDVKVSLFSSDPDVGTVPTTLTIPYGKTYATTSFTSTYMESSATITAQASGYTTGQAKMTTYSIDQTSLSVTVTADPNPVVPGNKTNVTAYVTYLGGIPTTGATVKFTSSSGGTFAAVKEQGNGYYNVTFTAPSFSTKTNCTITASVSKTDYTTSQASIQIIVILPTGNVGTMQLRVQDDNGQPISDAVVSSVSQPAGMKQLMDTTNSTGYVTFPNATEGNYTINVNKQGYQPVNQTFNFTTKSSVRTLYLTKNGDNNQPQQDLTLVWLVLVAVIVVVVVVVAAYIQRRRTAEKFKIPKKWQPPPPPKH
jgi:hypothetical protein